MRDAPRPAKDSTAHDSAALVMWSMLMLVVLLPIVYVLSSGPTRAMVIRYGMDGELWNWFYAPLEWLYQNVASFRAFWDWYVKLWR